jgi:DNA-binding FrmR family transcriptional regulator
MKQPHARHTGQLERLRRIEGQVGGLVRMVEEERYCVDILTQIRAARAALRRVEESVLREHVEHCVAHAIRSGDPVEQKAKVDELVDVVGRFSD